MVHLTYVENPFDKDFFSSLSKYAYEKDASVLLVLYLVQKQAAAGGLSSLSSRRASGASNCQHLAVAASFGQREAAGRGRFQVKPASAQRARAPEKPSQTPPPPPVHWKGV